MGANTRIEWAHHTFNIVWGCAKVSAACKHCYAERLARRWGFEIWGTDAPRRTFGARHWSQPLRWQREAATLGERRRVFACSMADVFEDHATTRAELAKLWPLIRSTPQLDWLLLTKRPERIATSLPDDWSAGFRNVWLGTTIESSEHVGRADLLRAVPAHVRFVSAEPLLDDVDGLDLRGIHWLIAGGESGVGARAVDESWLHDLRLRCDRANVAFFFKQWGGVVDARGHEAAVLGGRRWTEVPVPG